MKDKVKKPGKTDQSEEKQTGEDASAYPVKNFPTFRRSLPMSLLRAREAVMRKFTPSLQQHGLSPQQWRVMRALDDQDGMDISELSRRCFLLKPSLSRIVQNLVSRKILKRQQSDTDQRRAIISLTSKGRGLINEIIPFSEERYAYITEKFGYGKLQLLYELLDELMEKLEETDITTLNDETTLTEEP